jgi:hypothetical protein
VSKLVRSSGRRVDTRTERVGYEVILDRLWLLRESRAAISCGKLVNLFKLTTADDDMREEYQAMNSPTDKITKCPQREVLLR